MLLIDMAYALVFWGFFLTKGLYVYVDEQISEDGIKQYVIKLSWTCPETPDKWCF